MITLPLEELIHKFTSPEKNICDLLILYGSQSKTAAFVDKTKQELDRKNPNATVIHTNGNIFYEELITNHRLGLKCDTQTSYWGEFLLFEEIQTVAGKLTAEQTLYGIIDYYLEHKRKILITSTIPPHCIHNLAPRIQAQLAGGLNIHIE